MADLEVIVGMGEECENLFWKDPSEVFDHFVLYSGKDEVSEPFRL